MTGPAATPRPRPRRGVRAPASRRLTFLFEAPRIATARRVWGRYNTSSGPLLARGLAFTTLFMLVPALLLIVSIAGLVGGDLERRARIVDFLVEQFPPLAELLKRALDTALAHAGAFTLLGSAILAWSASALVRDLDRALGAIFHATGSGPTMLRMVGEIVLVAFAVVGLGLLLVVATIPGPISRLLGLVQLRVTAVVPLMVAFALVYRLLPPKRPGWRDALVPAAWVGLGASLLTAAFGLVSPVLFGSADLYGALAGIFLGLVWLSCLSQLFLVGAAWVAIRAETRSAPAGARESATG